MSEFLRRALPLLKRATMRELRTIENDQRAQAGRRRKIKGSKRPCRSRPRKPVPEPADQPVDTVELTRETEPACPCDPGIERVGTEDME